ncbi:MAG: GAF domain-containing protein [Isosphaeraceae bacterium]
MGNFGSLLVQIPGAIVRWLLDQSIVVKITIFVGLMLATLAGVLTVIVFRYTSEMLQDQINNRLSATADHRHAFLRASLEQLEERARILAGRYRLLETLDAQLSAPVLPEEATRPAALEEIRAATEGLLAFWVEDGSGRMILAGGPRELIDVYRDPAATRLPSRREPAIVGLPRPVKDTYAALLRMPVRTRRHGAAGSLLMVVDVGSIMAELADPRWLGETGEVLVGLQQGDRTRFLFPPRHHPEQTEFPSDRTEPMNRATSGQVGFARTVDRWGRDVLVAYRPLPDQGWGLVAKLDVEEAYAPVRRLRSALLAVAGTILAVGLAASYLITRQNTAPLRRLASAADAIARGERSTTVVAGPGDEIGRLGSAFARMTEQLARSQGDLEARIAERTRDLEATRDLLDAFFHIFTSRVDSENIDRTFESVLRFCHQLGYGLALISLVDREHGLIRGVRGAGTMAEVVGLTVRPLEGDDILAQVVRDGRAVVIADSTQDPRCDLPAVAMARIRGQIILPLVGDGVLGTLQVATPDALDPRTVDLRPLESLASHTARALSGLRQVEEIGRLNLNLEKKAEELLKSEGALREQTRILRSVLDCMREGVVVADRESRLIVFNPAAERILGRSVAPAEGDRWRPEYGVYHADRATPYGHEDLPLSRAIRGESLDEVEVYIAHDRLRQGRWMLINARPLRDDQDTVQGGLVVFHDVTRRRNDEKRLTVQFATTRVLTEVDSLDEAASQVLGIIGEHLDWDYGGFWKVDRGSQVLRCGMIWQSPGHEFPVRRADQDALLRRRGAARVRSGQPCRALGGGPGLRAELPAQAGGAARTGRARAWRRPIVVRRLPGRPGGLLAGAPPGRRPAPGDDDEPRSPDRPVHRAAADARAGRPVRAAGLARDAGTGVAHEINNPLAYIGNNLAVLERDVRALLGLVAAYERSHDLLAAQRPEDLAEIERLNEECDFPYLRENLSRLLASTRQGVTRMGEIVRNLRGFARLDRPTTDQLDLRDALASALEMIRGRLSRRHIEVEQHHGELPQISASPVQINQVFLNLLVNAAPGDRGDPPGGRTDQDRIEV